MYFFLQRYSERSLLAHCGLVENRPWGFQFDVKRLKGQHTCAITANSSTSLHPILSTKKIELQLPKNRTQNNNIHNFNYLNWKNSILTLMRYSCNHEWLRILSSEEMNHTSNKGIAIWELSFKPTQ